jgi:tripartite-type tricarboxylate transporter receptor subunit TctC
MQTLYVRVAAVRRLPDPLSPPVRKPHPDARRKPPEFHAPAAPPPGRLPVAGCRRQLVAPAAFAQAAAWPNKPVRMIVPFAPGGPPDAIARLVSTKLGELLGQPIVVENRGGAGGNIGTVAVAKSAADGYTVLMTSSAFAVNTNFPESGYSAERDFVPVNLVAAQPNVIYVHSSVPVKTLAEFMAYAKDRKLAFATPGSGTTPHLTGENLFNVESKLGLPAAHFRGAGPSVAAVLGGEPPVGSAALTAPLQNIKAGKLHALAVSSAKRHPLLPDVPTLAEAGFPDMLDYTWVGLFAPAGTPAAIVTGSTPRMQQVLKSPEMKDKHPGAGLRHRRRPAGAHRRVRQDRGGALGRRDQEDGRQARVTPRGQGRTTMAKLRHIALSVPDPEASAGLLPRGFRAGDRRQGQLGHRHRRLPVRRHRQPGAAEVPHRRTRRPARQGLRRPAPHGLHRRRPRRAEPPGRAGRRHLFQDVPDAHSTEYYEKKYTDKDGIIFDITHSGWKGAKA